MFFIKKKLIDVLNKKLIYIIEIIKSIPAFYSKLNGCIGLSALCVIPSLLITFKKVIHKIFISKKKLILST